MRGGNISGVEGWSSAQQLTSSPLNVMGWWVFMSQTRAWKHSHRSSDEPLRDAKLQIVFLILEMKTSLRCHLFYVCLCLCVCPCVCVFAHEWVKAHKRHCWTGWRFGRRGRKSRCPPLLCSTSCEDHVWHTLARGPRRPRPAEGWKKIVTHFNTETGGKEQLKELKHAAVSLSGWRKETLQG